MILNYMNTDTPTNFTEHIKTTQENETHLQRVKSNMRSQETSNVNVACMEVACVNLTKDDHHCNMCERTYQHKSSLDRHIKKIHERNIIVIPMTECIITKATCQDTSKTFTKTKAELRSSTAMRLTPRNRTSKSTVKRYMKTRMRTVWM